MMLITNPHIVFLTVFLFFVVMVFYLFGEGSVDGFDVIDLPSNGVVPPNNIKVVKTAPNGTVMRDSTGKILYGMIRIPQGSYAVPKKDSNGRNVFLEGSATDIDYDIKQVPYGYMAAPDQMSIIPSTQAGQYSQYQRGLDGTADTGVFTGATTQERNYNPNDVSGGAYHDTPGDNNLGKYYFYDTNGTLVSSDISGTNVAPVIYYIPGSYKYGASNYVPNYEDSVYMSRTTRQSTVTPVFNTSSILGGFCAQHKGDTIKIEEKCNALDVAACASTSCCVLLGGQKCVAGSDRGPTNPANYSDFRVVNKDVYYYQGKCYGNCM
jgi:hypothetical protein